LDFAAGFAGVFAGEAAFALTMAGFLLVDVRAAALTLGLDPRAGAELLPFDASPLRAAMLAVGFFFWAILDLTRFRHEYRLRHLE
jgi:hypothetical protein